MDTDTAADFKDLDYLLLRPSKFAPADFGPGEDLKTMLFEYARVLVIGAGGLGCEILKDLALSGFRDIHVIDMDKIDVTNLNRQFLFRMKDVGEYKAKAAGAFIMKRCPQVKVTSYTDRIQNFEQEFYEQFHIIIAGLDNIEARRWLNSMLHSMVGFDKDGTAKPETMKPLIDGGTEGFKGQARVILPYKSGCFECSLGSLPKQTVYPMCTIAETPRLPEHCIEYAYIIEWPVSFPGKPLDKDSPVDMKWVFEKALERAGTFGIQGVTYSLTMGVLKNIIPAIASTNALISAACVNEALKLATYCANPVDNYMMYMGQTGINIHTFTYEREENCIVCGGRVIPKDIKKGTTLKEFIKMLKEDAQFKLKNPSISSTKGILYIPGPPSLEAAHRHKLDLTFEELLNQHLIIHHEELEITDSTIASCLRIKANII